MTTKAELQARIARLHQDLSETDSVDGDSRNLLSELIEDIKPLLEPEGEKSAAHSALSLIDRLREATRQFEASHPTLAEGIGRVIDSLSKVGI